jgi:hypothetical protein
MARVNLLDLVPHIIKRQKDIYSELGITGAIDPDKARQLTGCNDYHLVRGRSDR